MTIAYVTLEEMLQARDERCQLQRALLSTYHTSIVSFNMNIPGPIKRTLLVELAFEEGLRRLTEALPLPLRREVRRDKTGCEAMLVCDMPPAPLKEITTRLEEQDELGRLFDMDVLGPEGEKLSRPAVRRCLVCGGPVQACARSRAHSLETLQERTEQILKAFAREHLADCAVNALLAEARLTPKPGLVDEANNGAHRDMDLSLLERSAYGRMDKGDERCWNAGKWIETW